MPTPTEIVDKIISSSVRKNLFHYTDIRNLTSIAHFNAMFACQFVDPAFSNGRRTQSMTVSFQGQTYIANDQLVIAETVMEQGVSQDDFRNLLDKHIFFWPTLSSCIRMLKSYNRRYPNRGKAVFRFQARELLLNNFERLKLCKYNSGSSPLYPQNCTYKKGPSIFLKAQNFGQVYTSFIPTKSSEVTEILIENKVENLEKYIQVIYCDERGLIPDKWQHFYKPLSQFDG